MNERSTQPDASLPPTTTFVSARELQSRLFDLGYYDGPVDGKPWAHTFIALAKFQHDHGFPATGDADPATMQALRESYCY